MAGALKLWYRGRLCSIGFSCLQHSIQSVAYLMTKLWRSTMTLDRELLPQIQEVKECAQRLTSLGYEISDELQAIAIILSLPLEYETLQTILTTHDSPPTLEQTVYTIQAHELKRRRDQENVLLSGTRPLKGKPTRPRGKPLDRSRCANCRSRGHTIEQCWSEGGGCRRTGTEKKRETKTEESEGDYSKCRKGNPISVSSTCHLYHLYPGGGPNIKGHSKSTSFYPFHP